MLGALDKGRDVILAENSLGPLQLGVLDGIVQYTETGVVLVGLGQELLPLFVGPGPVIVDAPRADRRLLEVVFLPRPDAHVLERPQQVRLIAGLV